MAYFAQQPEVVPFAARVFGDLQEVAAEQPGLVAAALELAAVAFQGAAGEVSAAGASGEAAGVVVVLQLRGEAGIAVHFEQQFRLLEVVVAAGELAGAGFQAEGQVPDHRLVGEHAAVRQVGGAAQLGEGALIVAEQQQVAVRAVAEVVVDAFLLAQALDEVQIRLVVLHAVVTQGVGAGASWKR